MTCIVILGMHRSGTSAFAGALNLLGVSMGKELLEPAKDNPKGFYENKKITFFNEYELLPKTGRKWDDLLPTSLAKLDEENLKEKAYFLLRQDYEKSPIWGIKDPRLCILFPFWEDVIKRFDSDIRIIISYRNPVEVAYSLFHRNNFSIGKGLLLWTKYNIYAEYHSRRYKRIFISYDDLLKDPLKKINQIQDFLNISFPTSEKESLIREFLDKQLKNFNLPLSDLPENAPSFIKETACLLKKLASEEEKDSLETRKKFDLLREKYESEIKYIYDDLIGEKELRIQLHWKTDTKEKVTLLDIMPVRRTQDFSFGFRERSTLKFLALKLLNKPCILKIDKISLILENGREIDLTNFVNTNAVFVEEKRYTFLSEPEIFISESLNFPNPKELKIKISYLKLSDEIHSEVQEKLIKLKQENEILRTKCIELENELQAIYRSKSWRITKPLREIKKILSRPKGCK